MYFLQNLANWTFWDIPSTDPFIITISDAQIIGLTIRNWFIGHIFAISVSVLINQPINFTNLDDIVP